MKTFAILDIDDLDNVDYSQVIETSRDTIRKSLDGTKFFIKWNSTNEPNFDGLERWGITPISIMSYGEMLEELQTPEWKTIMPA